MKVNEMIEINAGMLLAIVAATALAFAALGYRTAADDQEAKR